MGVAYDNIMFIEITCLCMCVHMCVDGVRVHMYMCIWYLGACVFERELMLCKFRCTCVCTNGGSQKVALVSSLVTLYFFWGQNLSLNLELTNLTRLACERNPEITLFHLSSSGVIGRYCHMCLFTCVLGSELKSSQLCSKQIPERTISQGIQNHLL